MKKRVTKIANFLAFNLLFFSLYLNFVYQDKAIAGGNDNQVMQSHSTTQKTTVVNNPSEYLAALEYTSYSSVK